MGIRTPTSIRDIILHYPNGAGPGIRMIGFGTIRFGTLEQHSKNLTANTVFCRLLHERNKLGLSMSFFS